MYALLTGGQRHKPTRGPMTETERRDWKVYRTTGDVAVRNRLAERHLALVHHFAHRMEPRTGGAVEADDLVSAGVLGLLDAVGTFDPGRGYRFSTFAGTRIRGAMLDELRRRDVAPRSVRRNERKLADARSQLTVELDRAPSDPELADVLGVDAQTLWRWKWDIERSRRVSLTALVSDDGAVRSPVAADNSAEIGIEERLTREHERARLRRELGTLPERERLIVRLYDLESQTLREIGRKLGVSESRVSQLRTRALGRLREQMRDLREAA